MVAGLRKAFKATGSDEIERIQALIAAVDLTKPDTVQAFVTGAAATLKGLDRAVAKEVVPVLEQGIEDMYRAAKISMASDLIKKGRSTNERLKTFGGRDERVLDLLNRHQQFYVAEGYANRIKDFDGRIRDVLSNALAENLPRKEVATRLQATLGSTVDDPTYWNVVGSSWLNRTRNWSALETMSEAGLETFVIIEMGDERMCPICGAMNGKEFSVAKQIEIMEESARSESLDELKNKTPWLTLRKDDDGNEVVGLWRKNGRFSELYRAGEPLRSAGKIQDLGVAMPPYHGLCRGTVGVV